MRTISVLYKSKKVNVYINPGIFSELPRYIPSGRSFVITDEHVYGFYGAVLKNILPDAGVYIMQAGEQAKTLLTLRLVLEDMLRRGLSRTDTLIALGGGVVTDVAGLAAALFKRGCNFLSVPTSLLAQADSALGGKTAVNHLGYKNEIGAIYHPSVILIDPDFLNTLPPDEYKSGIGEIIKYGLTLDASMFYRLYKKIPATEMIYAALRLKARVTRRDEYDRGKRLLLNYGHTIGHAIESQSCYEKKHGIAVAAGMYYETADTGIRGSLLELYKIYDINIGAAPNLESLRKFILQDKKIRSDRFYRPVLKKIGKAQIIKTTIDAFLEDLQ